MVLDAVARIEQSLSTQKQQHADDGFADALTAIKAVIDEARNAASVAIDELALEQNLAPVRKGARIMKEISWRWREIGADGRICDLIDQQVAAIEASCDQLGLVDPRIALSTAFDLIARRLVQFGEDDDAPVKSARVQEPVAKTASPPSPSPAAADEVTQAAAKVPESATHEAAPEAHIEAADATAPAEATSENMEMSAEDADAHDEAVLDLIAMEMAAVDPSEEDEEESQTVEAAAQLPETPAPAPEVIAPELESSAKAASAEIAPPVVATPATATQEPALAMQQTISSPAIEPSPVPPPLQPMMEAVAEPPSANQHSPESLAQAILEASPEPSLGSAIVASGIIQKPITASDPLASLRRLTQAEKIALFS
jgi:hypothetical protein